MPYTVIDVGPDVVAWAVNAGNDVLFEATGGAPVQVRLAGGDLISLPPEVISSQAISDNGFVLCLLADGPQAWCEIATGQIEPIEISGQGSVYVAAMNSRGDVAGAAGAQAFVMNFASRAVTLVAPSLPTPAPGFTSTSVAFNDLNDQGQAVGAQQWTADGQVVQPLWFDGTSLHPIGPPAFGSDAEGALITNDLAMRITYDLGGDSIFDAATGVLTPFAGWISDMQSGGRVLWSPDSFLRTSSLTSPAGVTPVIDLFPPGSGFIGAIGLRMNASGTIVGYGGKSDGAVNGFILIPDLPPRLPLPEPVGDLLFPEIILLGPGGRIEVIPGDAPGGPVVFTEGTADGREGDDPDR